MRSRWTGRFRFLSGWVRSPRRVSAPISITSCLASHSAAATPMPASWRHSGVVGTPQLPRPEVPAARHHRLNLTPAAPGPAWISSTPISCSAGSISTPFRPAHVHKHAARERHADLLDAELLKPFHVPASSILTRVVEQAVDALMGEHVEFEYPPGQLCDHQFFVAIALVAPNGPFVRLVWRSKRRPTPSGMSDEGTAAQLDRLHRSG